jgi:hypothetical protein
VSVNANDPHWNSETHAAVPVTLRDRHPTHCGIGDGRFGNYSGHPFKRSFADNFVICKIDFRGSSAFRIHQIDRGAEGQLGPNAIQLSYDFP